MPSAHQPPSWYISGMRGYGKSDLVSGLHAHWYSQGFSVWCFDPMREHTCPLGGKLYRPVAAKIDSEGFDGDGPLAPEGNVMARDLWLRKDRKTAVASYDDVNLLIVGRTGPSHVNLIIHEGRHRNIGFCFTVRRPAETPRDYSSEANHRVAFRHKEVIDVDALHKMGVPHGKMLDEMKKEELYGRELPHMDRGEFWHSGMGVHSKWHFHTSWMMPNGQIYPCMRVG